MIFPAVGISLQALLTVALGVVLLGKAASARLKGLGIGADEQAASTQPGSLGLGADEQARLDRFRTGMRWLGMGFPLLSITVLVLYVAGVLLPETRQEQIVSGISGLLAAVSALLVMASRHERMVRLAAVVGTVSFFISARPPYAFLVATMSHPALGLGLAGAVLGALSGVVLAVLAGRLVGGRLFDEVKKHQRPSLLGWALIVIACGRAAAGARALSHLYSLGGLGRTIWSAPYAMSINSAEPWSILAAIAGAIVGYDPTPNAAQVVAFLLTFVAGAGGVLFLRAKPELGVVDESNPPRIPESSALEV